MKNKSSVVVKKNQPAILKRIILIPDNVGICINCAVEAVSIKSDNNDETSESNPAQE